MRASPPPSTSGTPRATDAILRRGARVLRPREESSAERSRGRGSKRAGGDRRRRQSRVRGKEAALSLRGSRGSRGRGSSRTGVRGDRAPRARGRAAGPSRARVDRRRRTSAPRRDDLRSARDDPRSLPARVGSVRPRATRGPRKNALARDENPLRRRRGNRRSSRVGIELHLASKAIGLGGPGGESHVLCVTLRTGATAENADIGRRLRGASGRLRGTHAWERRGERSVVVVHSEPEKHAVGSERSVERDAATRRVRSRRGLGKAPRATGRVDAVDVNPSAPKDPVPVRACALRVVAASEAGPFTSRVFSSH